MNLANTTNPYLPHISPHQCEASNSLQRILMQGIIQLITNEIHQIYYRNDFAEVYKYFDVRTKSNLLKILHVYESGIRLKGKQ